MCTEASYPVLPKRWHLDKETLRRSFSRLGEANRAFSLRGQIVEILKEKRRWKITKRENNFSMPGA